MGTCVPSKGNSDLYGLSIRIGVYLQWISAWVNFLLDLGSAQSIFDANSIFVFAIAIAIVVAAQNDAAPIEMYIMFQFTIGFFVSSLSIMGIRLWIMDPAQLAKMETALAELDKSDSTHGSLRMPDQETFSMLKSLKPPGFTWSGVFWRAATAAIIAAYNVVFWFGTATSSAQQPPSLECAPLYIFMFSRQHLEGPIIVLGKVAAIIIAMAIFP